jgi:tetratricopeptide (TPR) repeat protein
MVGMKDRLSSIKGVIERWSAAQAFLLLVLVAVLLAPTLRADFLWDDFSQIVDSATIGDPSRIPFYFTHNVVQSAGGQGRGADGVDTYRPLFMVSLAAVYAINGADPFWFHLAVLVAHLSVCLLLWSLAIRWLGSPIAAAVAVLFFGCHPVTAEAYLWSSALPEPLAAAGLLAAVVILERQHSATPDNAWSRIAPIAAGVVFLAGLLSKEVVLLALPPMSVFLVASRRLRIRRLAPLWAAAAIFLVMRLAALGGLQATGADLAQRIDALRIWPVVVLDGLRSMITMTPVGIRHLSWEYASLGWGRSLAAAATCSAVLVVAVLLRRTAPLVVTAVLTTGLMLAPIALVATVPGWGGFGRYLYLPLAMTTLAFAQLATVIQGRLIERQPNFRWAIPAVVVTALVVEQVGLRHALWVYANQENLARAAIEIFPEGPDGWEWLGNVYLDREDLPAALECYREATERGPTLYRPRHNLAAALLFTGHPEEALLQIEILDSLHPPTADRAVLEVTALVDLERWQEATLRLVDAIDRYPDYAPLSDLAARLVMEHPAPGELRSQLAEMLARPQHQRAAAVLNPLLRG